MNIKWQRGHRTQQEWEAADLEQRTKGIGLKQRLDVVILLGGFLAVLILFIALMGLYLFGNRLGLMEEALIEPMKDERILNNMHETLEENPLLDATQHREYTWMIQQNGQLSRCPAGASRWPRLSCVQ